MRVVSSQWPGVSKKAFLIALGATLLALCFSAEAQPTKRFPRIGFLSGASFASTQARGEAFRQGLRALGYVEGTNVVIDWRFAEGNSERLPSLAAEIVHLKVDVIVVAGGEPVAFAAKGAEILRETVLKLSRLGIITNPTNSFSALALKEIEAVAQKFGISLQVVEARSADDFEGGFALLTRQHVQALLQVPDPTFIDQRTRLIGLETKSRLPTMHSSIEYADAGALMAYGAVRTELFRRTATYVDKILKGAKPADLPVEQPTKFEFVSNLKTAKQIGLTVPPNVLARADRVIR